MYDKHVHQESHMGTEHDDDQQALEQAMARRDAFLAENPHLIPMQAKLDHRMNQAGTVEGRMAVLAFYMHEHLLNLHDAMAELRACTESFLEIATAAAES